MGPTWIGSVTTADVRKFGAVCDLRGLPVCAYLGVTDADCVRELRHFKANKIRAGCPHPHLFRHVGQASGRVPAARRRSQGLTR